MSEVQDHQERLFHSHDLVVWHAHTDMYVLPVAGVVVRQEGNEVLIRARVEGQLRELRVAPHELVER